jgi:hypothetical protein
MQAIDNGMRLLDEDELRTVSGGWGTVAKAAIGWTVNKALNGGFSAASGYLSSHAGGGADEGTWANIGHSQMTA